MVVDELVVPAIMTSDGIIFSFNDGDCDDITSNVNTDLDFDAMPGMTADAALGFDFNGVKKTIEVSGTLTDTGTNRLSSGVAITITDQRKWLEKILNGSQTGSAFSSTYTSTWNGSSWEASIILFGSLVFNEKSGLPNGLPFRMSLYVCDA
jgi:hypothetical protein